MVAAVAEVDVENAPIAFVGNGELIVVVSVVSRPLNGEVWNGLRRISRGVANIGIEIQPPVFGVDVLSGGERIVRLRFGNQIQGVVLQRNLQQIVGAGRNGVISIVVDFECVSARRGKRVLDERVSTTCTAALPCIGGRIVA